MAFVDATSAEADTVAPPTHQVGDTLVAIIARIGSASAPTIPTGWHVLQYRPVTTGTARALVVAWKIAETTSEGFGSWTNASLCICAVFRTTNFLVGGGSISVGQNATTSVQYVALVGQSILSGTSNRFSLASSLLLGIGFALDNTSAINTPPTGMVHRHTISGAATGRVSLHDTNGSVSSWSLQTVTVASTDTASVIAELADSGVAKSSGSARPSHPFLQQVIG